MLVWAFVVSKPLKIGFLASRPKSQINQSRYQERTSIIKKTWFGYIFFKFLHKMLREILKLPQWVNFNVLKRKSRCLELSSKKIKHNLEIFSKFFQKKRQDISNFLSEAIFYKFDNKKHHMTIFTQIYQSRKYWVVTGDFQKCCMCDQQRLRPGRLIWAFASGLNILWLLSYWPSIIWSF